MTTFAHNVASFLPGHFAAYARVFHPFGDERAPPTRSWRELTAAVGVELGERSAAADFALTGVPGTQAPTGTLPRLLIEPLIEHLARATVTPERCFFAVWDGFGGSAVPDTLEPKLALPNRDYHVFAGPIDAATTSFSDVSWIYQSANLWWPSDQAWCVATEIDLPWTYVGGPRSCIDALLADPRLEAVETSASADW